MFSKADVMPKFIVMFILAIAMFFVTGNLFASYLEIESRDGEDLLHFVSELNEIPDGRTTGLVFHGISKESDFVVILEHPHEVTFSLATDDGNIEVTFDQEDCQEDKTCICLLKGVTPGNDVPRSTMCTSSPLIFLSPAIQYLTNTDGENYETHNELIDGRNPGDYSFSSDYFVVFGNKHESGTSLQIYLEKQNGRFIACTADFHCLHLSNGYFQDDFSDMDFD
ncbi:MAG: hypothetical protein ACOCUR_00400 [Nanoarchaeota archaeon]